MLSSRAHRRGFQEGALLAAWWLISAHDQPTVAAELLRDFLGLSVERMRQIAREEEIDFPRDFWREPAFQASARPRKKVAEATC